MNRKWQRNVLLMCPKLLDYYKRAETLIVAAAFPKNHGVIANHVKLVRPFIFLYFARQHV